MAGMLRLEECTDDRAGLVGGKATGLGSLIRAGLRVPAGFAISAELYRDAVARWGLREPIASILATATDLASTDAASAQIRGLFDAHHAGRAELVTQLAASYQLLGAGEAVPVAVRSSATGEDSAAASFAGQQDTYLWVCGADAVARSVIRCWGSLFTPQAISYRARLRMPLADAAMGIVVQRMVPAAAAGVMITIDPVTGDRSQISIEACYGLGAAVANGEVNPDRFAVDKVTLELRAAALGQKAVAYRFDAAAGEIRLYDVPGAERAVACVSDDELRALAGIGKRLEESRGCPQDIEWAIDGRRELFLLQSRPETVWSRKPGRPRASPGSDVMTRLVDSMMSPLQLPGAG
jgi:pyruvate,water dikinase